MKNFLLPLCLLLTGIVTKPAHAQDIAADPGAYMNAISNAEMGMNKSYMAYISASAHSSRKRKIEKMRDQAVDAILTTQGDINFLPPYKGDNSLRQNAINYVKMCYKVFNEDYAHIVNLDDIAERSYDEMQAYLLLQQATNDTLQAAIGRMNRAESSFAAKYGVKLIDQQTELGDKMKASNKLSLYRDKVYLLFYKCNWEDNQLTEMVNQKNVTKIEQVRSAITKYAIEGIAVLDTMKSYEGDNTLAGACRQALVFYRNEAQTEVPKLTDYFLKEENFNKLKTAMDAKADKSQQDVDAYNKGVNDINAAVNTFNQTNTELTNSRNDINKSWSDTEKTFVDAHTPYYK